MNTVTYQFVQVTANDVRKICHGAGGRTCSNGLLIGVTAYSGNTEVRVSPGQFALAGMGRIFVPATAALTDGIAPRGSLLQATVLQPDDDGDYASGTLVFLVPRGSARFSLRWHGVQVATFLVTAGKGLREAR